MPSRGTVSSYGPQKNLGHGVVESSRPGAEWRGLEQFRSVVSA
jgi:hypothetical protein